MESVNYKDAYAKAEAIDKELRAVDFHPTEVELMMEDGSHFLYDSAFTRWVDDDWIAVFAEHYAFSIHHKDDIYWCKEWEKYEDDKDPVIIHYKEI